MASHHFLCHCSQSKEGGGVGIRSAIVVKNNMISFCTKWILGEKSELQMEFEPATLRVLIGCSNHVRRMNIDVKDGAY